MLIDQNEWGQFEKDIAPVPTTHTIKDWMGENFKNLQVQSSDMNLIESTWAWIEKELVKVF